MEKEDRMMRGVFIGLFGETPRNKILEFLLEMKGLDFTIGDISREVEINRATTYNVMEELIKEKIVVATRKISGAQAYKLNKNKEEVKLLVLAFNSGLKLISEKPRILENLA